MYIYNIYIYIFNIYMYDIYIYIYIYIYITSCKDTIEECVMDSQSENIEIMNHHKADQFKE